MAKNLQFGGKGKNLVTGDRVDIKGVIGDSLGTIQDIKLHFRTGDPTEYRVKRDSGVTCWVSSKKIRKAL
jgi:hypothetical protein